jgi:hypothetical protein
MADELKLTAKELRTLRLAASDNPCGLYPGIQWDVAPKRLARLYRLGLVADYIPHNPVHKGRAVATKRGHELLAVGGGGS